MSQATSKARRLRDLIHARELLVMPGVHDPLSARLVEEAGFAAAQCSGFAISLVHLGLPDYSFLSLSDMLAVTRTIVDAVDIPVMADGDTGFGNAGVIFEDQVLPMRCGHLEGKTIIPIDEAVAKVRACAEARVDPDFVINARTDALAVGGIDEVVRRGNAYMAAGATMIFVDGMTSRALAQQAVEGIGGPVAINVVEGGKSQLDFGLAEMEAMGIARVSLPVTLMLASIAAMREALAAMKRNGRSVADGRLARFADLQALAGFPAVFDLEKR